MQLVCPVCQSQYPLEAAMNDLAARQAVVRAFELTEIGSLLIRYVQLFKPAKSAMSMARLAKLLDEIVPMIKAGQIERHSRTWPAPQLYWQQAIEHMLDNREKLSLPLKSHGYLLEIIAGYGNKAEARHEQQAEQGRQYGALQSGAADTPAAPTQLAPAAQSHVKKPRSAMPPEVQAQIHKMTSKLKKGA